MAHAFVEHTGEVEIELEATSESALFEAALLALAELVESGDDGRPARHNIELAAGDGALLLAEWLSELAYLVEMEDFVPERLSAFELNGDRLSAIVEGHRGHPRHLVKAVTLHNLLLEQREGTWYGRIVLDV